MIVIGKATLLDLRHATARAFFVGDDAFSKSAFKREAAAFVKLNYFEARNIEVVLLPSDSRIADCEFEIDTEHLKRDMTSFNAKRGVKDSTIYSRYFNPPQE